MSSDVRNALSGDRLPRNYLTILEAIHAVESGTHLTAQDVFTRAKALQPKLGFATVHRGLARLSELGFVLKLDVTGAAAAVYERTATPHAHFRCTDCGRIDDVDFAVPRAMLEALATRHGVQIATESTTFAGRCANCSRPAIFGEAERPKTTG